jgi:hypothetical protein
MTTHDEICLACLDHYTSRVEASMPWKLVWNERLRDQEHCPFLPNRKRGVICNFKLEHLMVEEPA